MTEQPAPSGSDMPPDPVTGAADDESMADDETTVPDEPVRTGLPAVDEVLDEVDRLDGRPLDEHLAAFERAHDSLRSALDAEPGEPA